MCLRNLAPSSILAAKEKRMLTQSDGHRLEWSFEEEPSVIYPLGVRFCANPFCACEELTLEFKSPSGDGSILRAIDLDIAKKRLVGVESLQDDKALFARSLVAAMDGEDWGVLFKLFYNAKEGYIVEGDYRKLEIPDLPFDVDAIEGSSEMVLFTDIFPCGIMLPATVDGIEFLALDQYCVRKDCGCRSAMLSFVPVVDGRGLPEHQQAMFDYRSGKVEIIPPLQAGMPRPERIIEAMIAANGQAAKELALRHAAIRFLFALAGSLLFGVGFLWALVDRESLFLHDRLAGTRIVNC